MPYNESHIRNTVFELEGYQRYTADFQISASDLGCFGYRDKEGEKRYFDIGLTDLQLDPLQGTRCEM